MTTKTEPKVLSTGEVIAPLDELEAVDISEKHVEKIARGYIIGNQAIGRRKEVRAELESRVVTKIGKKGKYLTDKLFELIEGVYVFAGPDKGPKQIKYYKVPPSLPAIIYALDRVLGKPVAKVEHSEEKKGIMIVESIIKNLAGGGTIEQKRSVEINE